MEYFDKVSEYGFLDQGGRNGFRPQALLEKQAILVTSLRDINLECEGVLLSLCTSHLEHHHGYPVEHRTY